MIWSIKKEFILNIYFSILFAIMAVFFLYIGVRATASKKPIFLPSKLFFAFFVVTFSPNILILFDSVSSTKNISFMFYINILMIVIVLVFLWIQMKGYIAIGVSDESFRNSLHYALNQNNIKFEERLSAIRLSDINADIEVSFQSWFGTGQLKLNKVKEKHLLPTLVSSINEYFISKSYKTNKTTATLYLVMGLFMLVFSSSFYFNL